MKTRYVIMEWYCERCEVKQVEVGVIRHRGGMVIVEEVEVSCGHKWGDDRGVEIVKHIECEDGVIYVWGSEEVVV